MQKHQRNLSLTVSAILSVAAGAVPAVALSQGGNAAGPLVLEEIVVTAERRETTLQTTPIAMTAVTTEQLAERHVNTIEDLQSVAPSLTVNDGGAFKNINIRGIGNASLNPSVTTGAVLIRDGVPEIETNALNLPYYDLSGVEVLRGPQGTFVGASSTGGALLINSRNPDLGGVNGYVEALVGDYNDKRLHGAVNFPMSDTFAVRFAFNGQQRDSFYRNIGASSLTLAPTTDPLPNPGKVDETNFRVGLLWQPTDSFRALLKAEINKNETDGVPAHRNQNSFVDPVSLTEVRVPFYSASTHDPYTLNYDTLGLQNTLIIDRYSLDLTYTLANDIEFRSKSGYQHHNFVSVTDDDLTNLNTGYGYTVIGPNDDNFYQEFTVVSPSTGPLTWIGGAAWFYRDTPVYSGGNNLTLATPEVQAMLNIRSITRSLGVFGQVSYQLTDTLQLQVGARNNWDRNYNRGNIQVFFPGAPGPFVLGNNSGDFEDSTPTAKVGLNWTPVDGQYVYVFAARGYKSGGAIVAAPTRQFDHETVNDYELGWKGKLLDGRMNLQLGAYYMKYENMQQNIYNAIAGYGDTVVNLGNSTIKGIEASMQARFAGLDLNVALAYNNSKLGTISNPDALVNGGVVAAYRLPLPISQGTPPQCLPNGSSPDARACFNYSPYADVLSGQQNPYSPELTASASVAYSVPVGANTLRPRVSYSYIDKQYASLFQADSFYLVPTREVWDAAVAYEADSWLAEVYVRNFTDETYVSGYSGSDQYYGAPRQVGLRFNRRF